MMNYISLGESTKELFKMFEGLTMTSERKCFHIFTPFKVPLSEQYGLKCYHHGVLLPDGSVIHLMPMDDTKWNQIHTNGQLQRTSLDEFRTRPNKRKMIVYKFNHWFQLPNSMIEGRAVCELHKRQAYNIVFKNCETFARWCVTNVPISKQVLQRAGGVSNALIGGGVVTAMAAMEQKNPVLLGAAATSAGAGLICKAVEFNEDSEKILDGDDTEDIFQHKITS